MTRIETENRSGTYLEFSVNLDQGTVFCTLRFMALIRRWVFSARMGTRVITNMPLALDTYHLPSFPVDLYATADTGGEPMSEDDFSSGRVRLYFVTEDEKSAPPDISA